MVRQVVWFVALIATALLLGSCGDAAEGGSSTQQVAPTSTVDVGGGELADFFGPAGDEESAPESVMLGVTGQAGTIGGNGQEGIQIEPTSVSVPGEQAFVVNGTGFASDSSVLVVFCVIPGEAVGSDIDPNVLAARLNELDAVEDCDVAGATTVQTASNGDFTAEVEGSVDVNTMIYAAVLAETTGAYVLIPIVV